MRNNASHFQSFHFLRILSAFGVVLIHTLAPVFTSLGTIPPWDWSLSLVLASSVRWCVPIFLMISGALLIHPKGSRNWESWFQKRWERIGVPLILSAIIYEWFFSITRNEAFNFFSIVEGIFFNQPYEHLWFLCILLVLYTMTPLIHWYLNRIGEKQYASLLLLLFFLTVMQRPSRFLPLAVLPYLSYYIAGYILTQAKWRISQKLLITLFGISIVCTIVGTYFITVSHRITNNMYFFEFTSPFVVIATVSAFLLSIRGEIINLPWVHSFSQTTLFTYLAHPIVLYGVGTIVREKTTFLPKTFEAVLLSLLTFLICVFIWKIFRYVVALCRREDLNLQGIAPTRS
jgi:surface polysaccharide O-acyltransferase-like enzyme